MTSSRLAAMVVVLAAFTNAGCQRSVEAENREEREANAKKVTADSTVDATDPIVEENFRFRLVPPGPTWKLLREQDASRLNPDAIAAAMESDGEAFGVILVERVPGTTLEQAVALIWQDDLPDLEVSSEEDLEFQGRPAKRRVFTASRQGMPFRYVSTVFLHQDHVYQLMSWSQTTKALEPLMDFQEAFELLDGEVVGRHVVRESVSQFDGVGWRIREGRYESTLSGLRSRLPEGWRFVVGTELEQLGSDAEIVFTHDQSSIFAALVVERVAKDRRDELAALSRQGFEQNVGAPVGEPITREVAGQRVELRRYGMPPLEYLHGTYLDDKSITTLAMWYPSGFAEAAAGHIDAMLLGFEKLPDSERARLHEELIEAPTSQRRFTANRAYRAGEFLDFEHQLRWTKPPGLWQVAGFDKALDHSKDTVLFAIDVDVGVYAALEVFASDSTPEGTLTNLIEGDEVLSRETVEVDGLTVHRAWTIDQSASPQTNYAFSITSRDGKLIAMIAWAADDLPASRKAMEAAIAGLDYESNLEPAKLSGRVYDNVRYGVSFELPTGFDGLPQNTELGPSQAAMWAKGDQLLMTLNIAGADTTDDEQWIASFFEQILRDRVSAEHPLGKPERSEGKLGTHTTRRLSWEQQGNKLSADIVVRGTLIYCMVYMGLSDAQQETVRTSWSLLE
jgi:hypothetical protein